MIAFLTVPDGQGTARFVVTGTRFASGAGCELLPRKCWNASSVSTSSSAPAERPVVLVLDGDALFQLPISYCLNWCLGNSPGYTDGTANVERPIGGRCLECHASSFKSGRLRKIDTTRPVCFWGFPVRSAMDPAANMSVVSFLIAAEFRSLSAIINPARLSRERQMTFVRSVTRHWGCTRAASRSSAATYWPMPEISKTRTHTHNLDVHGSQVQLLEGAGAFRRAR